MSIDTPESIAQRKGFEAGEAFGRAHCGHEAELAALRAALAVADEMAKTAGKLNVWCTVTHKHVPFGWNNFTAALARFRAAREKVGK